MSLKKIYYLAILINTLAAFFSVGFHHYDEHFQILEYLSYKEGLIQGGHLTTEFHYQMRSWFQPYIYYSFYLLLKTMGITSPFVSVFVFRLFTALLAIWGLKNLIPFLKENFQNLKQVKLAYTLLNFVWFVPYIQVRTSSEALGSAFFILGISTYFSGIRQQRKRHFFISGLYFGMAYLGRFQLAIMVACLWFWGLIFKRTRLSQALMVSSSIIIMIAMGIVVDYFGYHKWTFSLYNFIDFNIIKGYVDNYGIDPWWFYFHRGILAGIPPLSLLLLGASFYALFKHPKDPIVWSVFPLFIIHSLIGHKEVRFLFPAYIWTPYFLALVIRDQDGIFQRIKSHPWGRRTIKAIIGLNVLFLLFSCLRAANPSADFYRFVFNNPQIKQIYMVDGDPYEMVGHRLRFYERPNLKSILLKAQEFPQYVKAANEAYFWFPKGKYLTMMKEYSHCQLKYISYPRWSLQFNIGHWVERSRVWSLFKCQKKTKTLTRYK